MPVMVSSSVEIWALPTSTMRTGKGLGKARVSGPNTIRIRWSRMVAAPSVARSAAMGGALRTRRGWSAVRSSSIPSSPTRSIDPSIGTQSPSPKPTAKTTPR